MRGSHYLIKTENENLMQGWSSLEDDCGAGFIGVIKTLSRLAGLVSGPRWEIV